MSHCIAESIAINSIRLITDALYSLEKEDAEAAKQFVLGHLKTIIAMEFGFLPLQYSDACKKAIHYGRNFIKNDIKKEDSHLHITNLIQEIMKT